MNLVDVAAIILVALTAWRGFYIGFLSQVGSTIGFIGGMWLGLSLANLGATGGGNPNDKMLAGTLLLLALIFIGTIAGQAGGIWLKGKIHLKKMANHVDNWLGVGMALATALLGLWFATAFVSLLSEDGGGRAIRNSFVFNVIDRHLPPASRLLSSINHLVDPNSAPQVFSGREPAPEAIEILPNADDYETVINQVAPSIVRIQGLGCGGLVNGTGWVLSKDRVVTNAHVVAGVKNPKVYDEQGTHDTKLIYFDPYFDLAVLKVPTLDKPPLQVNNEVVKPKSIGLVIGYPGGGTEKAQAVAALEHITAIGRDIYDENKTERQVYVLQATIGHGNSGGPLLDEQGRVTGVVFGASTQYNNIGYALSLPQLTKALEQAKSAQTLLSSGACSKV